MAADRLEAMLWRICLIGRVCLRVQRTDVATRRNAGHQPAGNKKGQAYLPDLPLVFMPAIGVAAIAGQKDL